MSSGATLKDRMRLVGAVKAAAAAEANAQHMALSPGERIEAGIRLSQAVLRARPPHNDDDLEVMLRIAAHLKRLVARG